MNYCCSLFGALCIYTYNKINSSATLEGRACCSPLFCVYFVPDLLTFARDLWPVSLDIRTRHGQPLNHVQCFLNYHSGGTDSRSASHNCEVLSDVMWGWVLIFTLLINVKKLTSLKLGVRTTWWTQSTKTAKIFWVTLDGAVQGGVLRPTSWL